jgi:hypothetical protein
MGLMHDNTCISPTEEVFVDFHENLIKDKNIRKSYFWTEGKVAHRASVTTFTKTARQNLV